MQILYGIIFMVGFLLLIVTLGILFPPKVVKTSTGIWVFIVSILLLIISFNGLEDDAPMIGYVVHQGKSLDTLCVFEYYTEPEVECGKNIQWVPEEPAPKEEK